MREDYNLNYQVLNDIRASLTHGETIDQLREIKLNLQTPPNHKNIGYQLSGFFDMMYEDRKMNDKVFAILIRQINVIKFTGYLICFFAFVVMIKILTL